MIPTCRRTFSTCICFPNVLCLWFCFPKIECLVTHRVHLWVFDISKITFFHLKSYLAVINFHKKLCIAFVCLLYLVKK